MGRVAPGLPALVLAAAGAGCPAAESWRNADLQLDVLADLPAAAARVRICVEGIGSRTQGAGPDAYAVPGLPAGRPAVVTVDVLGDEDTGGGDARVVARAGPVALDAATPWREAVLETHGAAGPDPCTATGGFAPEGEDSWLLAVRFGR